MRTESPTHFDDVRDLKAFQRRLRRWTAVEGGSLETSNEALFHYALDLVQLGAVETEDGDTVSIRDELEELRRWMIQSLVPLFPDGGEPDPRSLAEIAPVLALRLDRTRREILDHHTADFSAQTLDEQVRHKELVLVLGGGGGSGLFHLGVLDLVEELDLTPDLLVGSSMGSAVGLLRAFRRDYAPRVAARALPRDLDRSDLFRPFTGYTRYGFPGAFHFSFSRIARSLLDELTGSPELRFSDLDIPLEVVVCGILSREALDPEEFAEVARTEGRPTNALADELSLVVTAMRQLTGHPERLQEVVFGSDETTRHFPAIEAVGFSCAVPGLIHFDVFHDDPGSVEPLEKMFEQQGLLRLCDGAVVNLVPARVAWESVQAGRLDSRNAHIAAFDVFAPRKDGSNTAWNPVQQLLRPSVESNRPFADHFFEFDSPPSPLDVLVNSYSEMTDIVDAARDELEETEAILEQATNPLPPYGTWDGV